MSTKPQSIVAKLTTVALSRARSDGEPRLELIAEVVAVDLDRDRPPVAGAHHRLLEAVERRDSIVLGDPRRS